MVEYQGKRVVTLAMIDSVHQRPEGTAKRNFTENRHRFIDGEDFYLIDYSKKNEFHQFGIEIPARGTAASPYQVQRIKNSPCL